ncbi:hypothetical protein ACFFMP_01375 [Pseudoroseomonas cervicalis]|uniref:Uncharacterized protein n=1 Tax=Pseudoroseomonas cervicalis ATCC 49957 TaxID=525371 RepID=D5RJ66_9PROT|nr:hypothetical protein [Pseudoroseomonas cervicalis]EFH12654.1 hypothetical protein HMPREF0731_1126 [Pseudoroseomonas cervicalis ATCC 49957]
MSGVTLSGEAMEALMKEMVQILADLRHHNARSVEMLERIHQELVLQRSRAAAPQPVAAASQE